MIIDMHSHYFPLEILDRLPQHVRQAAGAMKTTEAVELGGHKFDPASPLFNLEQQIRDMRTAGLDGRSLIIPPFALLYELSGEIGLDWSRAVNDGMADAVATHPDGLFGFATVPLQDVPASIGELDRAVSELGLVGVEIATSIAGRGLDDGALDDFWERCEQLRIPILIHPHYVAGAERMQGYHLRNLVGNPSETALAGARLLFGGVLERYPEIRVILSHGGGALPWIAGRIRHGFEVRTECQEMATDPVGTLSRFYYDTIVFDARALERLSEAVGTGQLVLGSDYPFDMAEEEPVAFVRRSGLPSGEADSVLNAGERLVAAVKSRLGSTGS